MGVGSSYPRDARVSTTAGRSPREVNPSARSVVVHGDVMVRASSAIRIPANCECGLRTASCEPRAMKYSQFAVRSSQLALHGVTANEKSSVRGAPGPMLLFPCEVG